MNRVFMFCVAMLLTLQASCKGTTDPDGGGDRGGQDEFNSNSLSSYTGYTDAGASWQISGGVLQGTGPAIQSVLIRKGVTMTDGWVEAVSRYADDGGLVLRFQNSTNYYLLTFRDDEAPFPRGLDNLAIYHHSGFAYNEMWTRDVAWPRGTQRTIRFEAVGTTLRVYFNGELMGSVTPRPEINDPTPYFGPGGVGVRHYGDDESWVTRFESFRWQSADAES